jgi:8-oxo-dGTP pyrophosphatase MutT (NUDIX family)
VNSPTSVAAHPVTPRDAATVAVVRDAPGGGVETLLLRRTHRASFVAGAHVFPGGAVDGADATMETLISHPLPTVPSAFVVAAVRECFEEAGLLFATGPDAPHTAAQRHGWRSELARGDYSFEQLVARESLQLDTSAFGVWSRWVTPVGQPKRFDTRFFVAVAPAGQDASPDDTEITECRWYRPADALALADAGSMLLITPTRATLAGLRGVESTSDLLATAQAHDALGNGSRRSR